MTGPKSHEQELAFKARSVDCRSHMLSPQGPRATLVTHPEPSPRLTCWPAGYHSGWWCHRGSRTAGGCCLWGHQRRWKLNGAAKSGSPQALSPSLLAAHPGHQPLHPTCAGSSPSVLLPSVKSWLCMIFSTMSSASMRVSSTQVGWLSTESFFLLGWGRSQDSHTTIGPSPPPPHSGPAERTWKLVQTCSSGTSTLRCGCYCDLVLERRLQRPWEVKCQPLRGAESGSRWAPGDARPPAPSAH